MKTYEIIKTVTQEQIDDVLTTAFEGGISYWCGEIRVPSSDIGEKFEYASEALTRGHHIQLFDLEESNPETNHSTYGVWHKLTLNKLLRAFGNMNFDFDNYDASDADQVVQKAIFGEIVYG